MFLKKTTYSSDQLFQETKILDPGHLYTYLFKTDHHCQIYIIPMIPKKIGGHLKLSTKK